MSSLNELYFLPYNTPPHRDEDDQAKEMWFESAHETYEDLSLALRITNEPFWTMVANNSTFTPCLESYLRFGPRPFDLEHVDAFKNDHTVMIQQKIHRSVFLLYARLASFRRCKINGKTNDDLLAILVAKKVFDSWNILDICSVYYDGNSHRLTKVLELVFAEGQLASTMKKVVDHLPNILNDLADELGVTLGAAAPLKLDGPHKDAITAEKLVDVISFLADMASSLFALSEIHRPFAELMHKRGMEITLAAMYEAVFPVLSEEMRNVAERDTSRDMKALELRINWTRKAFIKLVRRLIVVNCIDPLWDRGGEFRGKSCPLADDFFQIMSSCANEQLFVEDYLAYFPFADDLDVYEQTGVKTDETMKQYVIDALKKFSRRGSGTPAMQTPTRLPALEAITEQQYRAPCPPAPASSPVNAWQTRPARRKRVAGAELESLITQVTDLLPNLGRGFVHACMEHFDYQPEATINGILEDHLPEELRRMDRNADSYGVAGAQSVTDESFEEPLDPELLALKSIHKGKRETLDSVLTRKPELSVAEKERYWHYGNATEFLPNMRVAEAYDDDDEYDDTYDAEPEFRPEGASGLLEEKPNSPLPAFETVPLNERKSKPASQNKWSMSDEEDDEADEEERKRRRDAFCENPEEARRRYEQRRGSRGHRGGSVRGAPRGTGQDETTQRNRRRKEENKSVAGNHNRRAQAQWKRRPF